MVEARAAIARRSGLHRSYLLSSPLSTRYCVGYPRDNSGMKSKPETPDIVALLRNADEQDIRRRLDELDAEATGLRTLLRAVRAKERVRRATSIAEDRRDD